MSNDELEARMRALEACVRELAAVVKIDLRQVHECCERHDKLLYGSPENQQDNPGLNVRVDRLESRSALRRWGFELIAGAIVGVLAALVTRFL